VGNGALRRPPSPGAASGDGSKPVILVSKQIKFSIHSATRVPAGAKAQKPIDFACTARWPRGFLNSLNRTAQYINSVLSQQIALLRID
jgi:hypothetical protein